MSLFTAIKALEELKEFYQSNPELRGIFETLENHINAAEANNDILSLAPIIEYIKQTFHQEANRSYFSPVLWLPFDTFFFPQKIYTVISNLEACLQAGRKPSPGNIAAFDLPSLKPPAYVDVEIEDKFIGTREALAELHNEQTPEYMYQKWHQFYQSTQQEKSLEPHQERSWWQQRHINHYFKLRQGIQNQLAFAYLFNQYQQAPMNYAADWRRGDSKQTGYGYVTALALPKYNLENIGELSTYTAEMSEFDQNRFNSTLDQADIKHNRLTSLMVATTKSRAKDLLDLAKDNHDQHLNIKLLSRSSHERYTYLKYDTSASKNTIVFCDPRYGLFQFNDDADFLFFYRTLYAKEQLQTNTCWNRYQVSNMRYAPDETTQYTWRGMLRSLFSGIKYNSGIIARINNFLLFNTTLFIYITTAYMITSAITVLSPFVGTLMLMLLAQKNGSMFVSSMFTYGSSGLRSAPDFIYAMFLTLSDLCKSLFGTRPSYDEALHTNFDLQEKNLERAGSFGVLHQQLNIAPIELPPLVLNLESTLNIGSLFKSDAVQQQNEAQQNEVRNIITSIPSSPPIHSTPLL